MGQCSAVVNVTCLTRLPTVCATGPSMFQNHVLLLYDSHQDAGTETRREPSARVRSAKTGRGLLRTVRRGRRSGGQSWGFDLGRRQKADSRAGGQRKMLYHSNWEVFKERNWPIMSIQRDCTSKCIYPGEHPPQNHVGWGVGVCFKFRF